MLIYFIMIFTSVFFAFLAFEIGKNQNYVKSRKNKMLYWTFVFLAFLFPFLLSAFRAKGIGTDTSGTYYEIYIKALYNSEGVRDFGFYFLNQISLLFSDSYNNILFVTSFLVGGFAYLHIFKKSKNPVMSTYLFFATNVYFVSMNMIRQCIATMIFVFAIEAIKDRKFLKYMFIMFICFSIHSASIIYVPLYFICNRKIDVKKIAIIILGLLILSPILSGIFINVFRSVPYFSKYFSWYFVSSYNNGEVNMVSLIISICILIVLMLSQNKDKKFNFEINCITWMQILAFVLLVFSSSLPLMQRTSWMFTFPLFIYLPECINNIKNKNLRRLIYLGVIVGYTCYMFVTIFILKYNEVVPYVSIFN